jgi:hypothetical protein
MDIRIDSSSEVPIRRQLTEQVVLDIESSFSLSRHTFV